MSSTATALVSAEAISAAVFDLWDKLAEIVSRGRTDDPVLLREVRKLVSGNGTIGRKIAKAQKLAEPPAAEPASAVKPSEPEKPAAQPRAAEPTPAKPAAEVPSAERVMVRLNEPGKPPAESKPPARSITSAADNSSRRELPPRGRHRRRRVPVRRPQLLVVTLILLAAVAIAVTGNPLVVLGSLAVGGAVHAVAPRFVRRRAAAGGTP